MNAYEPHVIVVPEDDANRELANGFMFGLDHAKARCVRVMPVARGWKRVVEEFTRLLPSLHTYASRHVVLLMDFDGVAEERRAFVVSHVPTEVRDRVFVLGTRDEPKDLKHELGDSSHERIGKKLAKACEQKLNTPSDWDSVQLRHNAGELTRLHARVHPMLF